MKIAFQGEPGAYSEQAVFEYFGDVETVPCESFDVMFDSVVSGVSDAVLAPIEIRWRAASTRIMICFCGTTRTLLANIYCACAIA